jgi:hypothetical protein
MRGHQPNGGFGENGKQQLMLLSTSWPNPNDDANYRATIHVTHETFSPFETIRPSPRLPIHFPVPTINVA